MLKKVLTSVLLVSAVAAISIVLHKIFEDEEDDKPEKKFQDFCNEKCESPEPAMPSTY